VLNFVNTCYCFAHGEHAWLQYYSSTAFIAHYGSDRMESTIASGLRETPFTNLMGYYYEHLSYHCNGK